jgi:hypothetical protein
LFLKRLNKNVLKIIRKINVLKNEIKFVLMIIQYIYDSKS